MVTPRVHEQDGVAVLEFGPGSHSLDEAALQSLQDRILSASNVNPPLLVVDLSHIEFFGSSFIEVLYRVWSRLQARGGRFALCGLSPYCREVIEVTNLNTLWTLYDSLDEAVAGIRAA
jgi:anti-sigma B factor antagonist